MRVSSRLASAAARLHAAGIVRIESYAWRDLSDPEGGGSELHADEIMARWAAAGLEVVHRTSVPRVDGRAGVIERRGYRIERRGGRFDVFGRVIAGRLFRRRRADTATVEIWNGVPFLSPLWAGRRRVVWLHHLHEHMWADVLPEPAASIGRFGESRLAPPLYRRTTIATLSDSSAEQLRGVGLDHLRVIPPGIDAAFTPAPSRRAAAPRVVVVGRLAPVKRQRVALEAVRIARERVPELTVDVIGDGPDRAIVEAWIDEHGAEGWVRLLGFVDVQELIRRYQSAWVVLSASKAEGWGMSLTEAAACGTPAVATDIAGHRGSVVDGVTGDLVADPAHLGDRLAELLLDDERRATMSHAAVSHAAGFSWDDVAARHLELLADVVERGPDDGDHAA